MSKVEWIFAISIAFLFLLTILQQVQLDLLGKLTQTLGEHAGLLSPKRADSQKGQEPK